MFNATIKNNKPQTHLEKAAITLGRDSSLTEYLGWDTSLDVVV